MKRKYTVMINYYFIHINKINNYLSPQNIEHKKTCYMMFEIQALAWDRHTNVAGLNWLMGSQPQIRFPATIQIYV